jgi:hypothetical protein
MDYSLCCGATPKEHATALNISAVYAYDAVFFAM